MVLCGLLQRKAAKFEGRRICGVCLHSNHRSSTHRFFATLKTAFHSMHSIFKQVSKRRNEALRGFSEALYANVYNLTFLWTVFILLEICLTIF